MRWTQAVVIMGFMAAPAVWAGSQGKPPPAARAPAKPLPTAQQQLASRQAEVKRLEQDLGQQESDSKRAAERLRQQDQAIAELQRQLHELQAGSAAGAH